MVHARAHAADDPATAEDILLCAGDADTAAALLIGRLSDPALRDVALLRLCDFDPPPGGEPNPFYDRYVALKARADVQAAIARAGGIRRFHLQRSPS